MVLTFRAAIGLIWVVVMFGSWALWRLIPTPSLSTDATIVEAPARSGELNPLAGEPPGSMSTHPDLYGNEIEDAVVRYQIDARGALYELHSPETAMVKLGPPRM